jgi:hypothetical protein
MLQGSQGLDVAVGCVIAKLNFFPSLITSARLAFTLPASLSLHSLPSQSFSWLHLAPFLPASFEGKKCVSFAAAPVCGLRLAYTFPSTSPSARSGANSILPINTPRPFLRDSKSLPPIVALRLPSKSIPTPCPLSLHNYRAPRFSSTFDLSTKHHDWSV